MSHLLVTNDFPPKVGGIQSYLWELWRRLPPERVTVLTTPYDGARQWDAAQPFRVERTRQRVLLPTPSLVRQVDRLAADVGAGVVVLDPALPLGLIGRHLRTPHAIVVHGAEVTVPGRLPVSGQLLGHVLRGAAHVIAAGGYPAAEARRAAGPGMPPVTVVPPSVDPERFRPLDEEERKTARAELGLPADAQLVVSVSRLVPRKGMDTLIDAAARMRSTHPDLVVAIAGSGRDRKRLETRAERLGAPVRFLGRVPDEQLPAAYGCGDVFAMLCRNRWAGLEQEGFGIVFVEAAACAVPSVAGDSGGAAEAVADGETGIVVRRPDDAEQVAAALTRILDDDDLRARMGAAARRRAETEFSNDHLATRLDGALLDLEGARLMVDDRIVRSSWVGTSAFLGVTVVTMFFYAFRSVVVAVDLVLFAAGTVAFVVALARAIARSRTEEITLPGLFFLSGTAPDEVRRQLLASVAVQTAVALVSAGLRPYTAFAFGILVPVYGLGLAGLWGATRGTYAPRG